MGKNNLNKQNLVKSAKFDYPLSYYDFIDFTEDLKKSGALLELIDTTIEPFEKYDEEEIKIFQKELNSIKKQKNKKKGSGDIIKCDVENGIYNVYNPYIRVADDEYEGKKYPQQDSFIFVVKK